MNQMENPSPEEREEQLRQIAKQGVMREPIKYLIPAFIKHYSQIISDKFPENGTPEQIEGKIYQDATTLFLDSNPSNTL